MEFDNPRTIAKDIPKDTKYVLLGECTHGTEEFYSYRAEITKYLIENRGFSVFLIEGDWPFMFHVNNYIHNKEFTPFPSDCRFPKWMWKNNVMLNLVNWMKKNSKCHIFGMDCYSMFESKNLVIDFLNKYDPFLYEVFKNKLSFMDKYNNSFKYGREVVEGSHKNINVQGILQDFLSKIQWNKNYKCTNLEKLSVEQNLEIMIAADEYYRSQYIEPRGSRSSWNTRDQHMTTTLFRINEYLDNPKIIIWAHNSHVGSSLGTPRGGINFVKNDTWNLGQMVKSTFKNSYIIGFYTYDGTLSTADKWGGKEKIKEINKPLEYSLENYLHKFGKKKLYFKTMNSLETYTHNYNKSLDEEYIILNPHTLMTTEFNFKSENVTITSPFKPLERKIHKGISRLKTGNGWITEYTPVGRVSLHCCPISEFKLESIDFIRNFPMLQRWIGTTYCKENEFNAHYGEVILSKTYDMVVYVDKTRHLEPIPNQITPPSNKRLLKEYCKLLKNPIENIFAHPLEDNILEWHFVIYGIHEPYTNGEYHGKLEFPSDFPMKPPSIIMFTPNGRFEINKKLCLTMSNFHPESWNPSWTIETLLVGFQSFMYQESLGSIGSIKLTDNKRKQLALNSINFNKSNNIFVTLFKNNTYSKKHNLDDKIIEEENCCRFCLNSGNLINPCECKGSNKWLHMDCLEQWQKSVLHTQSTHPKYQTNIDTVCNICQKPFNVKFKTRHQVLEEYTGKDIINLLTCGNYLVAGINASEKKLEIIEKYPNKKETIIHWVKSIFLIISSYNGIMGINLYRSIDGPIDKFKTLDKKDCSPLQVWNNEFKNLIDTNKCVVKHHIGGPCKPEIPYGLVNLIDYKDLNISKVRKINNYLFGTLKNIINVAEQIYKQTEKIVEIKIYWGFAGWGKTQILGEIARGSWGITDKQYKTWEDASNYIKLAKKTEYNIYNK